MVEFKTWILLLQFNFRLLRIFFSPLSHQALYLTMYTIYLPSSFFLNVSFNTNLCSPEPNCFVLLYLQKHFVLRKSSNMCCQILSLTPTNLDQFWSIRQVSSNNQPKVQWGYKNVNMPIYSNIPSLFLH